MDPRRAKLCNEVCDELVTRSCAVVPACLDTRLIKDLIEDATIKLSSGAFRESRIGRAQNLKPEPKIRGDEISWFEPAALSSPQLELWQVFEDLKLALNRELYLGLEDFEAHYAYYKPGRAYGKHVDRFTSDDARTVSLVLYLNENWTTADGGELRIDLGKTISVVPLAGTMVCFLSDGIEHEVLPSRTRPRLSVAAWFRKRKSLLRNP